MKENINLTDGKFWDSTYEGRLTAPLLENSFQDYVSIKIAEKIEKLGLRNKKICEAGGGDARILSYLARRNPGAELAVIDYSPAGCGLARSRAERENVEIEINKEDLFRPGADVINRFDILISQGVVEHFSDLPGVLRAKTALLKKNGLMFTLIPNFSSPVYRLLCRRWSAKIFNLHVAHDIDSFVKGHEEADLDILEKGYLGSVEFGMLSMARNDMPRSRRFDRLLYLSLLLLSIGVHWFEYHFFDFPAGRAFSPFIFVISRKK